MADSRIYFNTQPILSLNPITAGKQKIQHGSGNASFGDILSEVQKKVCFSHHAWNRLQERNINLSDTDLAKLDDTVDKLAQKGARESLVYMKDVALVVSVTNRTVITAMDGTRGNENIITNIDSAAIL
ncbi:MULTISPECIES: TIGR02530 family flagellar biosynthesis protein [Selenomonas]|uniref:Flagellar protein n=1 Tax=Selenomonas ruminis TaxID=2593411 RepID=A0A5D6W9S8_9FIRM|nr:MULTISPECIES: TIGR02530 family flagellar biosynthesis protein [unclassified Selenomonas]MBQ1867392.1 flagellar protein [Selenomonas sp.]TYZ23488.1 flagellar protein [Selenomonas sp. mPRGC5]